MCMFVRICWRGAKSGFGGSVCHTGAYVWVWDGYIWISEYAIYALVCLRVYLTRGWLGVCLYFKACELCISLHRLGLCVYLLQYIVRAFVYLNILIFATSVYFCIKLFHRCICVSAVALFVAFVLVSISVFVYSTCPFRPHNVHAFAYPIGPAICIHTRVCIWLL